jgi:hypothetical protein
MYNEETKRNNELVWASVFAHEINKQFGFDYTLVPERGENSPVDVYAVSGSGKFPQLQLQLTHAVELPFMAYEEPSNADYTKQPTLDAINKKCEKLKRQGADLSKLILIIQGYMNQETAAIVFADSDFVPIRDYDFQGIYYVSPPMLSEEPSESLQDGFIITIKNAFPI